MYERSANVLEKYFSELFGFDKRYNLKENFKNYQATIEEVQKYQEMLEEEENILNQFDKIAEKIQEIQRIQEKLYKSNIELEESRKQIFNSLNEDSEFLEKKLEKIDEKSEKNNKELQELKTEFLIYNNKFIERQKERNKCARSKRGIETNFMTFLDKQNTIIKDIDLEDVKNMKKFIVLQDKLIDEIVEIMIDNGKNEKIGFNIEVIKKAIDVRYDIAKIEAECYIIAYDRQKKLLDEINNDNLKLARHKKTIRNLITKLEFIEVEKEYIVGFLDNERLNVFNGQTMHNEIMKEACQNFKEDISEINKLYELLTKEISGKVSKKSYKELYDNMYLRNIEQKEKKFKQEIHDIKINKATIMNSNYWRIEGVKNIYEIFEKEVTEKFEKDLSEYKVEKIEEEEEIEEYENEEEKLLKKKLELEEYDDEIEFNYDEEDDDDEDEKDDEEEEEEDDEEEDEEDGELELEFEEDEDNEEDKDDEDEENEDDDEDEEDDEDDEEDDEDDENDYIFKRKKDINEEYQGIILDSPNKSNDEEIDNNSGVEKKKECNSFFGKFFKEKNKDKTRKTV